MNKGKQIRKAILFSAIPGVVAFALLAVLMKLVEVGKLSSVIAMIVLLVICIAVVVVVAKLLSSVLGCFSDVSNNIEDIAKGEAQIEFKYQGKNAATKEFMGRVQGLITEVVRIVKGIEHATGNLGTVVTEFRESFGKMQEMSENMQAESSKIEENARNQAQMTDQFIGSIESLGDAVDIIADQINELNDSAENMKNCNQKADSLMLDLVGISNQNGEAVENINRQTLTTNQSVQEIMEAVEIITSIAGKTNLLALNASIEAARAGEQGRGFAVVAEEIGELAVQSKNSSARIAEIVDALIQNSNESVAITKQLEEAFGHQKEKIQETEEIFGKLNQEIDHVTGAISEIDRKAEVAKNEGDAMESRIVTLRETVETNTSCVQNTVAELQNFEVVVDNCIASTEQITSVSDELIGYVTNVTEKRDQIKASRE